MKTVMGEVEKSVNVSSTRNHMVLCDSWGTVCSTEVLRTLKASIAVLY